MTDRVGQQLGNYQLLHLLGQGGFATLYGCTSLAGFIASANKPRHPTESVVTIGKWSYLIGFPVTTNCRGHSYQYSGSISFFNRRVYTIQRASTFQTSHFTACNGDRSNRTGCSR